MSMLYLNYSSSDLYIILEIIRNTPTNCACSLHKEIVLYFVKTKENLLCEYLICSSPATGYLFSRSIKALNFPGSKLIIGGVVPKLTMSSLSECVHLSSLKIIANFQQLNDEAGRLESV